jgi:hypothetical protein
MASEPSSTGARPTWSIFDGFEPPARQTSAARPTWSIFDGFERPRQRVSWRSLDGLVSRAQRYVEERCRDFPALLRRWDEQLAELEGDPSRSDWTTFRPLRTDREEDWSDWLQHFIGTSRSGHFSRELFSRSGFTEDAQCALPHVIREDVTEDRRADLVIQWSNGQHSQLEVKVGDQAFSKTSETASRLEHKYPAAKWTHYILLPAEDLETWQKLPHAEAPLVHVFTWDDVAVALRRSLRRCAESRRWLTWAHGFCGLIEQKLLRHPPATQEEISFSMLERRAHQISIMKKGLEDV